MMGLLIMYVAYTNRIHVIQTITGSVHIVKSFAIVNETSRRYFKRVENYLAENRLLDENNIVVGRRCGCNRDLIKDQRAELFV